MQWKWGISTLSEFHAEIALSAATFLPQNLGFPVSSRTYLSHSGHKLWSLGYLNKYTSGACALLVPQTYFRPWLVYTATLQTRRTSLDADRWRQLDGTVFQLPLSPQRPNQVFQEQFWPNGSFSWKTDVGYKIYVLKLIRRGVYNIFFNAHCEYSLNVVKIITRAL